MSSLQLKEKEKGRGVGHAHKLRATPSLDCRYSCGEFGVRNTEHPTVGEVLSVLCSVFDAFSSRFYSIAQPIQVAFVSSLQRQHHEFRRVIRMVGQNEFFQRPEARTSRF